MWKKFHRNRNDEGQEPSAYAERADVQNVNSTGRGENLSAFTVEPNIPSHQRITSSVYSRGDTAYGSQFGSHPSAVRDSQYTDVSPPVSPIHGPNIATEGSPDISPIDETPGPLDRFPDSTRQTRNGPLKRKNTIQNRHAGASKVTSQTKSRSGSNPLRSATRDDFSGEPTTNEKEKAAPATPGRSLLPVKSTPQKTPFSIIKSGKKFLELRRQQNPDDPANAPPPREPWKGASGRSAIVNPIKEKKEGKPFTIPLRTVTRMRTGSAPIRPQTSDYGSTSSDETIMPPVPPKDDVRSVSAGSIMSQSTAFQQGSSGNKQLPDQPHHGSTFTSLGEQGPTAASTFASGVQKLDLEQEPRSRFSMTTYAATDAGSPPLTPNTMKDVPPLPGNLGKVAARKPTPSEVPTDTKTLPHSPHESEATSRIEALKARQNEFARRRAGIDSMIHELTQVIQPSPATYDLATRNEVKKTVDSLKNELAEIKKEEYEIGMTILRIYKKQEEEDVYGQTSALWVRRAGS